MVRSSYRSLIAGLLTIAVLCAAGFAQAGPVVGGDAPAFKLQDGEGKWHSLSDYRGQWVVLYFYPKDGTPGCTTQACEFRDNVFAFKAANAVVLGVSVDDIKSHKAFAAEHHLPFTLLADPTRATAKSYGVIKKYPVLGELAGRETFLIDAQGKIVKHYSDVTPKGHSEAVLADIKSRSTAQK